MASLDQLIDQAIRIIYLDAHARSDSTEYSGAELIDLISSQTGTRVAQAILTDLIRSGLLQQTRAIADEDGGYFEITGNLIKAAEELGPKPITSDSEKEQDNRYFKYRYRVFGALIHASDVLGGPIHRVNFALHDFVDEILPDWTERSLRDLESLRLIEVFYPPSRFSDDEIYAGLTDLGDDYYQRLMPDKSSQEGALLDASGAPFILGTSALGGVPAADRIVRRTDNEPSWQGALNTTRELVETLESNNEYRASDPDDFEQRLHEVRALQVILDAPQVQWEVLDRFAKKTIKYLATKFADTAIGYAASALIVFLLKILTN